MQLEHKAHWAIKKLNMDIDAAGTTRKLQLCVLEEIRLDAYESAEIYKEKTKKWHDKHIHRKEFFIGETFLVYDSRFHLFPRKFKSRWFGPCQITKVYSSGAIQVKSPSGGLFTVNGQRLNHYYAGDPFPTLDEEEETEPCANGHPCPLASALK